MMAFRDKSLALFYCPQHILMRSSTLKRGRMWNEALGREETVKEHLEVLNEFKITGQDKQRFIFGTKRREKEKSQVLGPKEI